MTDAAEILNLNDGWTATCEVADVSVGLSVPGDVHSALLAAGRIENPYWRDNETKTDWVHRSGWTARRSFNLDRLEQGHFSLRFESVDCLADVFVNGERAGFCESQFLRHDFDVTGLLREGENVIEVVFHSNSLEAERRAENSEFPMPHTTNSRIGHLNFLRKTQCHGGWDWGIALCPLGFYDDITLVRTGPLRLDDVAIRQRHEDGAVELDVTLHAFAFSPTVEEAVVAIDGHEATATLRAFPGENRVCVTVRVENPRLWWPAGQGEQAFYDLAVSLGGQTRDYRIGLRDVELLTDADEIGNRFAFRINGREIFMKGANWIPGDALPERASPEQVRDLLQSAVDANMNMIRIWGGGQYEADWFYELCDELGLMIWHDFMFACNLYPAHDRRFLDLVRKEARQQLRRLSRFASIALWCGDNELVGALTWYKESLDNRDRYLAIYDRLNHALEEAVEDEDLGLPFRPSSPSVGRLDFGDGWHVDTSGDMHFWDVWHSARDFEHYRSVRPRFCSEFGFQSFPSMRVIESFTTEEDRNVSSAVMDVHQRNEGGNSRIVETIARYFRFPDGFEDMVYLSQLGQGLAMKTAIEFWRSSMPRTMGTLFWQLNDTWPVASWSSLEYGGGWKATQYLARRFFSDLMVTAQPDPETGAITLLAVSDRREDTQITVRLRSVEAASGKVAEIGSYPMTARAAGVVEVARIRPETLADGAFLVFDWQDAAGNPLGENEYLPQRPKAYRFGAPRIGSEVETGTDGNRRITLTSDRPALYVTYDHGGDDIYTDNCFTLLPGVPKTITVLRERRSHLSRQGAPTVSCLKG
ncbi:beta-mannosidase [Martelella radicis]|uniref:beta-mannosidase n=1 Tax=Martelella radicis TaxID=1397476 RepID=A0A7W6KGP4_9HYPH|nr:glycoside hydrolase family 2 protein [Martelella radicis]MBB4120916.1 beta-mannosidase [Martelella radicis]